MSPPGRDNPTLELKIISAKDVSHVSVTDKMDVYAVVSITGKNAQKIQAAKTPIDYYGGSNPRWNHTVKFSVNENAARKGQLILTIKLFSYWLEGENDLYLGEVNVSVHELLGSTSTNENINQWKSATYPVEFMEGTKGTLSLSYWFKPLRLDDPHPPTQDYSPSLGQIVYPNPDPTRSGQHFVYSPQFQTGPKKLTLELLIKSAKNIRSASILNEMNVYATVMICEGNKETKNKINTPTVYAAYKNPSWNHPVTFSVEEKLVRDGRLTLHVKLISVRQFLGETELGAVKISIHELFVLNPPSPLINGDDNDMNLVTESVIDSNRERGTLSFTYRFNFKEEPVAQPFIMYVPVPDHGTLGYMTAHPGVQDGPSNGLVPTYMQPQKHESHGYQPHLQGQPQSHQHLQSQPQQPLPLTQSGRQTQRAGPTVQQQGGANAALVLGAGILGRVVGEALFDE